ncbi:hypothetical protein [Herbaspirillum sp. GCM10030257]|uniref:hypothetical protein n=1 Tax=Herbaspirillum sp. GCM10030257 TaxID=3273393 RepID=UPI0036D3A4AB
MLERFHPDRTDDAGCFARGTALSRGRRGLLAMARHVASARLVPQPNHLSLAWPDQGESALEAPDNPDASLRQRLLCIPG